MNKVVGSAEEAIRDVGDGSVIMIGGFQAVRDPGESDSCAGAEGIEESDDHQQ